MTCQSDIRKTIEITETFIKIKAIEVESGKEVTKVISVQKEVLVVGVKYDKLRDILLVALSNGEVLMIK